jgi:Zn-finger nucleic acid-binding protein
VDICKGHGTWFDREELSHIVEFMRGGGLEAARARQKAELEEERRRLESLSSPRERSAIIGFAESDDERQSGIASSSTLLKYLLS